MNKITFLIDGFNVYHSILRLKRDTGYSCKWLDLAGLCKSYIPLFGREATLGDIYYFSAIPTYLSDGKVRRHKIYMECLRETGIQVELGRFKNKDVYCHKCKSMILKHEEKETDVAIAVKLLEVCITGSCDTAVIMSGDTDLAPAVRAFKRIYSDKKVIFAFPFARKNKELATLAPDSFSISKKQYIRHQLPNPVQLKNGKEIAKPDSW